MGKFLKVSKYSMLVLSVGIYLVNRELKKLWFSEFLVMPFILHLQDYRNSRKAAVNSSWEYVQGTKIGRNKLLPLPL